MFIQQLAQAQRQNNSLVCVGLDPNPAKINAMGVDLLSWLQGIVDATAAHVCAFKPQIAYFAAMGAETELQQIIQYIHQQHPTIPVILDAKRGDIGSTAEQYANEAFIRYQADAVTVNPYMGGDTIEPYTQFADKGVVVLCKTSNAGSGELQNLTLDSGETLFQRVAKQASERWNQHHNVLLVVGATYPEELAQIRGIVGDMPLLIPGIGAQGGDVAATLKAGLRTDGLGLIISSSRGIIYAGDRAENYAAAAQDACLTLKNTINQYR
ncbi:orotidine-5'-phosphate decarboxylase [Marinicella meishanensis]|uniref:orotidine-5'-phosphate decarboxylase n=1 Tax=Marinicella meishanensis TaxID=2873263 RepID=UPI001CC0D99A|nr:orotidine-5'-phosphate decarboxylase [Marinicella sp. NBU2979]